MFVGRKTKTREGRTFNPIILGIHFCNYCICRRRVFVFFQLQTIIKLNGQGRVKKLLQERVRVGVSAGKANHKKDTIGWNKSGTCTVCKKELCNTLFRLHIVSPRKSLICTRNYLTYDEPTRPGLSFPIRSSRTTYKGVGNKKRETKVTLQ